MNLTELDAIRATVEDLDVTAGQLVLDRIVELKMAAMTGDVDADRAVVDKAHTLIHRPLRLDCGSVGRS